MGRILEVSSLANPQVKRLAGLAQKKERAESGLFLVEGLQLVGFGVEAGWELETLVLKAGAESLLTRPIVQKAITAARYVMTVTEPILAKLSHKENPQGVLGVFKQRTAPLEGLTVPAGRHSVWVVLEEVRDPGNLGTILRTVDAVGAAGVILLGTCTDVWAPDCVRATMGSIFHVPLVKASVADFLAWKATQPGLLAGTHLKAAVDYRTVAATVGPKPLFLAMGTEQSGLTDTLADACDVRVRIAMAGGAESLNLAMATGVMLYEVLRDKLPKA